MPEKVSDTRRERLVSARLDQILDAAARLFAEKGFHRTTTRQIAEAAEVSEGTLYNYFENKNDLLFGILSRLANLRSFEAQLDRPEPHDAHQAFVDMFHSSHGFSEKHYAMQQAILSEILADAELRERYYQQLIKPGLQALEKDMQTHIQLGQIRNIDASFGARFLISLWLGMFILQVLGDPLITSEWEKLTNVSASIVFDGLGKPGQ